MKILSSDFFILLFHRAAVKADMKSGRFFSPPGQYSRIIYKFIYEFPFHKKDAVIAIYGQQRAKEPSHTSTSCEAISKSRTFVRICVLEILFLFPFREELLNYRAIVFSCPFGGGALFRSTSGRWPHLALDLEFVIVSSR